MEKLNFEILSQIVFYITQQIKNTEFTFNLYRILIHILCFHTCSMHCIFVLVYFHNIDCLYMQLLDFVSFSHKQVVSCVYTILAIMYSPLPFFFGGVGYTYFSTGSPELKHCSCVWLNYSKNIRYSSCIGYFSSKVATQV